jgi:V-type H+-transporting ATPase subunit E
LVLDSSGGILISAKGGRILCNNTLEQRLALAYEALLPAIRISLFGASESRKFTS